AKFRSVFSEFPFFNYVQSKALDDVHVVKDATRGATLEVVVSRMKAVNAYRTVQNQGTCGPMRIVAVSATIPNISDIADWLSDESGPATYLAMDESHRPVKLRKVVLGFPCGQNQTEFKFDLSLNYKMANIIQIYSDQKPALVFDTSATAVIMTKTQNKDKYTKLMNGVEIIESSLHSHLVEHLNAEIVLQTISDVNMALDWIRSTFLYIRALKNPSHYELCLRNLNSLSSIGLIDMDEDINIKPTETGKLMARYCIAFDTMNLFSKVTGTENLSDLIELVSKSKEFSDIQLRVNEKRPLNTLNKDKNRLTIRFPLQGKIKTTEMKVNCLIQAQLGSISIQEFGLTQDTARIFRNGMRISKCLSEFLSHGPKTGFAALLNSLILAKCFRAKLWENSPYVSKQLEKIGQTLSTAMVNAGLTTFSKIEQTNPRELELIVNRHPPFGNQIRESVIHLPKYEVILEQATSSVQLCYGRDCSQGHPKKSRTAADQENSSRSPLCLPHHRKL
ncbi:unnamed protein product, partial [Tetraodon nigroviridis]